MSPRKTVVERRRHKRHTLPCCVTFTDADGRIQAEGGSLNISDGGLLVSVPLAEIPRRNSHTRVRVSLPRYTSNTFMLEDIEWEGTVVRHVPLRDDRFAGVAVRFGEPLPLQLEA